MKNILITGGSKGIGLAMVKLFAEKNYNVYFTYNTSQTSVDTIQSQYNNAHAFKVNFRNDIETDAFLELIKTYIIPDVLINNFGINNDCLFMKQDLNDFYQTLDLNFKLPVKIIKFFIPDLINKRAGHIINISSLAAKKVKLGNSAYGVSKIALERFSQSLALEVARFNVKVNCISPGFVETDLLDNFLEIHNVTKNVFLKSIPSRKLLKPENIANLAFQLAENIIETTGSTICIGNGENILQ